MYCAFRVTGVGINVSARRHGVADEDILEPDRSGNMLEVVTLHFDDGGRARDPRDEDDEAVLATHERPPQ